MLIKGIKFSLLTQIPHRRQSACVAVKVHLVLRLSQSLLQKNCVTKKQEKNKSDTCSKFTKSRVKKKEPKQHTLPAYPRAAYFYSYTYV